MRKAFLFLSIITICLVSGCAHAQQPSPNRKSGSTNEQKPSVNKSILVAYFSRSGNTRETEERESGYKPPLKSKVQDIGSYDVIFIGFPIWGMAIPSPIRSFLSEYDLSGPAGSFMMGAGDDDRDAYDSEKPQHKVTISKTFYIGKYEVTQAQWEALMGSNPYPLDRSNPYYNLPGMKERIARPTHPATMSWNDAQEWA
jgi:flavodoxin